MIKEPEEALPGDEHQYASPNETERSIEDRLMAGSIHDGPKIWPDWVVRAKVTDRPQGNIIATVNWCEELGHINNAKLSHAAILTQNPLENPNSG